MTGKDSLGTKNTLTVGDRQFAYHDLAAAEQAGAGSFAALPYALKVLAENLLRHEDGVTVTTDDIKALGRWTENRRSDREIAYRPARVIMPDASGIPLLADMSAMRDAMVRLGGDPASINPLTPIDFIVDHSVIADVTGQANAFQKNLEIEYARNRERFAFLKWAQQTYENIRIVPPGNGIMHQVNLEYLARVVWSEEQDGEIFAYPDCLIGMDSHTPMINSMGIFGWGVGGLEAGAAMLGQPVSMVIPEVIGCRLTGRLPEGATATDLALTVTQTLRAKGVVQKFVEYCGDGLDTLTLTDRATVANMAPEYGATMGFFPVDRETLAYLEGTGRDADQIALVEGYTKAQGMWRETGAPEPAYTDVVEIDLADIETSLAGPSRPNQRTPLSQVPASFQAALTEDLAADAAADPVPVAGKNYTLGHGAVAIAAITSCTNTSNPAVLIGAGLLARKAVEKGLRPKPWVKTSLAPGSRIVGDYLAAADLQKDLDALGFQIVGYGCMTCMGASGPLDDAIETAIRDNDLVAGAVLSGNRNFEARIHPLCRVNYLASPPLVVAYALAGRLDVNLREEPLGEDSDGNPVMLADIWPSGAEIQKFISETVTAERFSEGYAHILEGGPEWDALEASRGVTFDWDAASTYLRRPPYFVETEHAPDPVTDITGARALIMAGDMTTTDHISPVSVIGADSASGRYLTEQGVHPKDFNNYMTRRGNHEVMIRGTFANIRFKNELAPGTEGGVTRHAPSGKQMSVFDAAMKYRAEGVPLVVIGAKEYGTGSSRDWAAKGTHLLGIRAVIAEGLERIHRSNLIGMGVLPLQFKDGATRKTLGLDGTETFDITGLEDGVTPGMDVACRITRADGTTEDITLLCRLDTQVEVDYFTHGGMLHYVLRQALGEAA